jgi:uncharacterized membrane protein YozB (DUF420 family)
MSIQASTKVFSASPRLESRFYIIMALVAMAIAIAGFGPTAVGTRKGPLTLAVGAHAVVFSGWLLLFLTQTVLIKKRRISVHRRLGYVGAGLAVLMVVSGFITSIAMARRGFDLSGDLIGAPSDVPPLLALQLGNLVNFAILVVAAVLLRRRSDVHKRLMLLATVGALMTAPLAHIIGHSPLLRAVKAPIILIPLIGLIFAGAVYDRLSRGRIHPVSLWIPLAFLIWDNVLAAVIGPSEVWRNFTAWLIR